MKLHLGVIDVPYQIFDQGKPVPHPKTGAQNHPVKGEPEHPTTGQVAEQLEDEYGVMQVFFDQNQGQIADHLANAVAGAIETAMMGGSVDLMDSLSAGLGNIERDFRNYIDLEEISKSGVPGVPTKAALLGINHRMKKPTTHVRRPSFRDTGQYQASFKAWIDNNED